MNKKCGVLVETKSFKTNLPACKQSVAYQELLKKLFKATLETGMVFEDFNPSNIVKDKNGKLYFIDLEITYKGKDIKYFCTKSVHYALNTLPDDYLEFLIKNKIIPQDVALHPVCLQKMARLNDYKNDLYEKNSQK